MIGHSRKLHLLTVDITVNKKNIESNYQIAPFIVYLKNLNNRDSSNDRTS
jgi:hypothetical protein